MKVSFSTINLLNEEPQVASFFRPILVDGTQKSPRIVNCPSLEHGGGGSDHEFSCEPALSHGSGFGNFGSGVSEG